MKTTFYKSPWLNRRIEHRPFCPGNSKLLEPQGRSFLFKIIASSCLLLTMIQNDSLAQQCMKDVTDGLSASSFFASANNPGEEAAKAFDNNNDAASKWYRGNLNTSAATPNHIGVNLGTSGAKILTGYLISSANDFSSRNPRDWKFQGSNNGSTWIDLDSRSNQSFSYPGQARVFSFTNTTSYAQYRILITETATTTESAVQIGEIEFYEKVCLEGTVTDQGTPLNGVTVAILGETYSIAGGGGNVLQTAVTNAAGKYVFNASAIPHGQFSVIVEPPVGYQIESNTKPFFASPAWGETPWDQILSIPLHYYTYDGAIVFQNYQQLDQSGSSVFWDQEQSNTATNRFLANGNNSNLNFVLKKAQLNQSCLTLNGTPPSSSNMITVGQNGTFGNFNKGTAAGSYLRVHPGQPGFSKDFSNTLLYNNQGYVNPGNTGYNYANKANTFGNINADWGNGVLHDEGVYTVTSYIGTIADLIDINNTGLHARSLLNNFNNGWRKTYGTTTGDVYDKFLVVNGTNTNTAVFIQPGLNLTKNISYLFSFDGKNANATTQNITTIVTIPYRLLNASNAVVASGNLTLPQSASASEDDPSSGWNKVFATLIPPATGTYTLEIRYPGGEALGNDFYLDNISLRALTDYGDAPLSYGEALHSQPAVSINSSCDPLLTIGQKLDVESANKPSANADGDNLDNNDDEDGVTFSAIAAGSTSYSVSVKVNNLTTAAAIVYGWMDWNHDGIFNATERVSANIPANTVNGTYTLTWSSINTATPVFARFRLSSDAASANPTGVAVGGEVEDYLIPVASSYNLTGKIWDDGNKDLVINGAGEPGTDITSRDYDSAIGATANLTVYVTDNAGKIVGKADVNPDGTYAVNGLPAGTFNVILSNNPNLLVGSTPASIPVQLPQTWSNTGISFPGATAQVPNASSGSVVVTNADVVNVNFGIQKQPQADPYSFILPVAPTDGQIIPLNGTWPSTGTALSQLTGRDLEDANTPQGLNGNSNNRDLVITTPISAIGTPTAGAPELWYNGQPISAYPVGPNGTGRLITNYDADLLEVRTNGSGYTGFTFDYAWVDDAGIQGTPANYKVTWTTPQLYKIDGWVWDDGENDAWSNWWGEPGTDIKHQDYDPTIAATANLTVYVTDNTGKIVGKTTVAADGTYSVADLPAGAYKVTLSNDPALVIGSTPTAIPIQLPATWSNTGTFTLAEGATGNGNSAFDIVISSRDVTGLDFGIEKAPTADPYSRVLPTAPVAGQQIPLNGTWPSTGSPLPQLTGRDLEDANTPQGLNGTNKDRTVVITTPISPIGTASGGVPELWYNGQPISSYPAGPNGDGHMIANYDANLLQVRTNGTGYTGFVFDYAWVDNGGIQGAPANYKVTWGTPLPVTLTSFTVKREQNTAQLFWTTTQESNSDRFEVQRSIDAREWISIGQEAAVGESTVLVQYAFTDNNPASGSNYYRLKMIDKDGTYTHSRIQNVIFDQNTSVVHLYPNPVSDVLKLMDPVPGNIKEITVFDLTGRSVYQSSSVSTEGINVRGLSNGIYILKMTRTDGTHSTHKVVVAK